jgi:aminoglycoside phosphotransferase (APT) family kinase protein
LPQWIALGAVAAQDKKMQPEPLPAEITDGLARMGFTDTPLSYARLTGGVSSDIWRIDLPGRSICVKRALGKLRVAADWRAPVVRNRYEARWMRRAEAAAPGSAPALLGQDEASGSLAMQFLPADQYRLWKAELRDGHADPAFAAAVGATLARIHAATAADPAVAAEFPTDDIFYDIRLEPYLVATAVRHPDRAEVLAAIVEETRSTHRALVHGDVSPKNILVGPAWNGGGPVFLDAECAWWGDPAFDLAFCLNHLLLKCLWTPAARTGFLDCFDALEAAYAEGIAWEPRHGLLGRVARLLPGLLLARVDGKSPVEYITNEADKDRVRRFTRALLASPAGEPREIAAAWRKEPTE